MIAFLAGFIPVAVFAGLGLFALTHDTFHILVGITVGGLGVWELLRRGYNVNIHKNYKQEALRNWKDFTTEKLEDDMAFMNAVYNKIHLSYRPEIEKDYWVMVDKYEDMGLKPDMNRVETLFYEYLIDPCMNEYLHRAMAIYS